MTIPIEQAFQRLALSNPPNKELLKHRLTIASSDRDIAQILNAADDLPKVEDRYDVYTTGVIALLSAGYTSQTLTILEKLEDLTPTMLEKILHDVVTSDQANASPTSPYSWLESLSQQPVNVPWISEHIKTYCIRRQISGLPSKIIEHIFQFLTPAELVPISAVDKKCRMSALRVIWRAFLTQVSKELSNHEDQSTITTLKNSLEKIKELSQFKTLCSRTAYTFSKMVIEDSFFGDTPVPEINRVKECSDRFKALANSRTKKETTQNFKDILGISERSTIIELYNQHKDKLELDDLKKIQRLTKVLNQEIETTGDVKERIELFETLIQLYEGSNDTQVIKLYEKYFPSLQGGLKLMTYRRLGQVFKRTPNYEWTDVLKEIPNYKRRQEICDHVELQASGHHKVRVAYNQMCEAQAATPQEIESIVGGLNRIVTHGTGECIVQICEQFWEIVPWESLTEDFYSDIIKSLSKDEMKIIPKIAEKVKKYDVYALVIKYGSNECAREIYRQYGSRIQWSLLSDKDYHNLAKIVEDCDINLLNSLAESEHANLYSRLQKPLVALARDEAHQLTLHVISREEPTIASGQLIQYACNKIQRLISDKECRTSQGDYPDNWKSNISKKLDFTQVNEIIGKIESIENKSEVYTRGTAELFNAGFVDMGIRFMQSNPATQALDTSVNISCSQLYSWQGQMIHDRFQVIAKK